MKKIKISFIIPVLNEDEHIKRCLDSIIMEIQDGDEIIVVDNGSSDNTVSIVKSYINICLINGRDLTVGAMRNVASKNANGDVLAFIDADCAITKGWRKEVALTFEYNGIAITGSKYDLPKITSWVERAWYSQKKEKKGCVNYINSGNLIILKKVFQKVGGFDEKLITGEDAELCLRLKDRRYVIFENPSIKTIHFGNPKNIIGFYKQQVWHGLGMFATQKKGRIDKPLAMTLFFILSAIISIGYLLNNDSKNMIASLMICLFSLSITPILTSIYRVFQYGKIIYFPQLTILYFVYYVARSKSIVNMLISTFACKKTA